MKYNIVYACGHEGIVNIYGKEEERNRKAEWLKTCDCPECNKAAKEEAENKIVMQLGFGQIEGSVKQVQWANKIRREKVTELYNFFAKNEEATTGKLSELFRQFAFLFIVKRQGLKKAACFYFFDGAGFP